MAVLIQRPLKGSRISSFYPVKALPPLSALDSAFQLQEYISLLIRLDVHDVERIVSIPGRGANDSQDNGDAKAEEKDSDKEGPSSVNVDEACWVYEQLRRLAQDLSHPLITMLQQECTRNTCPEMKAGEWLYLCVAHGNEGAMEQCCAIDYILHTLDSATALLNSPRAFPSRLSVPQTSHRHFTSLARRLSRIFAHAYFHHREAFEQAEAESSLYARFLALTSKFDLVPAEFLVIPPRLSSMSDEERRLDHVEPPRLLGASVEPRREILGSGANEGAWSRDSAGGTGRQASPQGPAAAQRRNESPRKFGRNRTDTMVYSEAFIVAEELAKSDLSEVDIDREVAAERAAAAVDADIPTSAVTAPAPVEAPSPVSVPVPVPEPAPTHEVEQVSADEPHEEAVEVEETSETLPQNEETKTPEEHAEEDIPAEHSEVEGPQIESTAASEETVEPVEETPAPVAEIAEETQEAEKVSEASIEEAPISIPEMASSTLDEATETAPEETNKEADASDEALAEVKDADEDHAEESSEDKHFDDEKEAEATVEEPVPTSESVTEKKEAVAEDEPKDKETLPAESEPASAAITTMHD